MANKSKNKDLRITIRLDASTAKCLRKIEGTLPKSAGRRKTSVAVRTAIEGYAAGVG